MNSNSNRDNNTDDIESSSSSFYLQTKQRGSTTSTNKNYDTIKRNNTNTNANNHPMKDGIRQQQQQNHHYQYQQEQQQEQASNPLQDDAKTVTRTMIPTLSGTNPYTSSQIIIASASSSSSCILVSNENRIEDEFTSQNSVIRSTVATAATANNNYNNDDDNTLPTTYISATTNDSCTKEDTYAIGTATGTATTTITQEDVEYARSPLLQSTQIIQQQEEEEGEAVGSRPLSDDTTVSNPNRIDIYIHDTLETNLLQEQVSDQSIESCSNLQKQLSNTTTDSNVNNTAIQVQVQVQQQPTSITTTATTINNITLSNKSVCEEDVKHSSPPIENDNHDDDDDIIQQKPKSQSYIGSKQTEQQQQEQQGHLLLSLMSEEVMCPVCIDILVESTTIVPCGHTICLSCLPTLVFKENQQQQQQQQQTLVTSIDNLFQQHCPVCREVVTATTPCRLIDNMISSMIKLQKQQQQKQTTTHHQHQQQGIIVPHQKQQLQKQQQQRMIQSSNDDNNNNDNINNSSSAYNFFSTDDISSHEDRVAIAYKRKKDEAVIDIESDNNNGNKKQKILCSSSTTTSTSARASNRRVQEDRMLIQDYFHRRNPGVPDLGLSDVIGSSRRLSRRHGMRIPNPVLLQCPSYRRLTSTVAPSLPTETNNNNNNNNNNISAHGQQFNSVDASSSLIAAAVSTTSTESPTTGNFGNYGTVNNNNSYNTSHAATWRPVLPLHSRLQRRQQQQQRPSSAVLAYPATTRLPVRPPFYNDVYHNIRNVPPQINNNGNSTATVHNTQYDSSNNTPSNSASTVPHQQHQINVPYATTINDNNYFFNPTVSDNNISLPEMQPTEAMYTHNNIGNNVYRQLNNEIGIDITNIGPCTRSSRNNNTINLNADDNTTEADNDSIGSILFTNDDVNIDRDMFLATETLFDDDDDDDDDTEEDDAMNNVNNQMHNSSFVLAGTSSAENNVYDLTIDNNYTATLLVIDGTTEDDAIVID